VKGPPANVARLDELRVACAHDLLGQLRGGFALNDAPHEQLMNIERASASTSVIDVLDRVLDKGIVMDAWVRVSVVGIDLITVEARVVVASFETYFTYADALSHGTPVTTTVTRVAAQDIQAQLPRPPRNAR
jgi:gas vesicle structural protein